MASYWPAIAANPSARRSDLEFANWMNNVSKIVFSKTLKKADWNNSRVVKEKISEEMARVKKQPGKDMIMWGGVSIVNTFIKLGLIDEYQLWVAPVVLGEGKSLFNRVPNKRNLTLVKTKTFSNGVVILHYQQAQLKVKKEGMSQVDTVLREIR
jgi:dihydrofolate reductase